MIHYSDPPILLHDVIENLDAVVGLLERNAPYHPLGGWFRPGIEADQPTSALWFQKDWVHDTFHAPDGGAPGACVSAIRAAQPWLKAPSLAGAAFRGVCMSWGCVPRSPLPRTKHGAGWSNCATPARRFS